MKMQEVIDYFEAVDLAHQLAEYVPFNTFYKISEDIIEIYRRVKTSGRGQDAVLELLPFCTIYEIKDEKIKIKYTCHLKDNLMFYNLRQYIYEHFSDSISFEVTGRFEFQFTNIDDFIDHFDKLFWIPIERNFEMIVARFGERKQVKGGRV